MAKQTPQPPPKRSVQLSLTGALLAFVTFALIGMWILLVATSRAQKEAVTTLPVSLRSTLSANYQADSLPTRPGVAVALIFDAIKDQEPDADLDARKGGGH